MTEIDWENTEALHTVVCMYQDDNPTTRLFVEYFGLSLEEELDKLRIPEPPIEICKIILDVAKVLYEREEFNKNPPPFDSLLRYTLEGARYRDHLLRLHRKLSNVKTTFEIFTQTLLRAAVRFIRLLPSATFSNGPHTIPITDLIDVHEAVFQLVEVFSDKELQTQDLFAPLRGQLIDNLKAIDDRKPIPPTQFKGSPVDVIRAYLVHTPLQTLFTASLPFGIAPETRFSGHWVIGPPNTGKTTLLHSLVAEDLKRDASIILMDSKGELIAPFRELKEIRDRLVIIEYDPDQSLALNPLDIPKTDVQRTVGILEYLFSSLLKADLTPLQQTLFRNLLPFLAQCVPNATMMTMHQIVRQKTIGDFAKYLDNAPDYIREFFLYEYPTDTYRQTRETLLWRLSYLRTNPLLAAMFSSTETKLDIGKLMDEGKVIIIDNSKADLEEDQAEFFGRFFVALVLSAAQQRSKRPESQKLPCYFYIDEAHTVIRNDARVATILDECRSQKIAICLAHQRLEQIKSKDVLSALQNCAVRMANSDDDAPLLAQSFRTTADHLRSLRRGQFATWTRELRNSPAVTLDIKKPTFGERMTAEEKATLKAQMRKAYYNPRKLPAPTTAPTASSEPKPASTTPEPAPKPPEQEPLF